MKLSQLISWVLLVLATLNSCKEQPIPFSPYGDLKSTSANFTIEQKVGNRWFKCDTVISGQFNHVRFSAKQTSDTYVWEIGNEIITSKTFEKTWLSENSFIPVKLIVTQNLSDTHNPNDNGVDTVIKVVHVWPLTYGPNAGNTPQNKSTSPYLPIYGTYYGESSFEQGVKKYVTIIDTVWTDQINRVSRVGLIRGIPYKDLATENQRNSTLFDYVSDVGVTALHLDMKSNIGGLLGTPVIPQMRGYAWLTKDNWNEITIEYEFLDTLSKKWIRDSFNGVRVW